MKKPRFGPWERVFFEYHCLQSEESCDAELWHHTRQRAVVVAVVTYPEVDLELSPMYVIRFEDGYQYDVFNDEVTKSPRPKPEERGIIIPSRNPWTPPSQLWPSYEYRVGRVRGRYGMQYEVWRIERRYGEQVRKIVVSKELENDTRAFSSATWHAQRTSADDPRNPNAVIVLTVVGTCYTAYRAGQEVGCSNPQPRKIRPWLRYIILDPRNPEEYEWASWAIDGMEGCMSDEDYEDFGYTPKDIPTLHRAGSQAWVEVENLNALEDLLYRIEEQANDMVDYEIAQFQERGLRAPAKLRAQKAAQLSLARKLRTAFDEMSVS